MFPGAFLAASPATLCDLLIYLRTHNRLDELDEIADQALQAWLDKAKADGWRHRTVTLQGYQWKDLFLPDGTRLRSSSYGQAEFAVVDGRELLHKGQPTTPNKFNSAVPGMVRNAWRDIFLQFPGESQWQRAIDCRRKLPAAVNHPPPYPPAAQPKPAAPPRWDGRERRSRFRRQQDLLLD